MFNTYQFSFILTVVAVFAMTNSTLAQTTAINNPFGEQVLINPKQQDILTIYADQREYEALNPVIVSVCPIFFFSSPMILASNFRFILKWRTLLLVLSVHIPFSLTPYNHME